MANYNEYHITRSQVLHTARHALGLQSFTLKQFFSVLKNYGLEREVYKGRDETGYQVYLRPNHGPFESNVYGQAYEQRGWGKCWMLWECRDGDVKRIIRDLQNKVGAHCGICDVSENVYYDGYWENMFMCKECEKLYVMDKDGADELLKEYCLGDWGYVGKQIYFLKGEVRDAKKQRRRDAASGDISVA